MHLEKTCKIHIWHKQEDMILGDNTWETGNLTNHVCLAGLNTSKCPVTPKWLKTCSPVHVWNSRRLGDRIRRETGRGDQVRYEFDDVIGRRGRAWIFGCGGWMNLGQHAFLINCREFLLNPDWGQFWRKKKKSNWKDSFLVVLRQDWCVWPAPAKLQQ